MLASYTFFSIFLFLLMVFLLFLFFRNSKDNDAFDPNLRNKSSDLFDLFLNGIHLIFFFFTLCLFVYVAYNQTLLDLDSGYYNDKIILGSVNIDNPSFSINETLTNDNFNVFLFDNIDAKFLSFYKSSKFCFWYNNSDASNVVRVTDGVNIISNPIYLINDHVGIACGVFNVSSIKESSLFGLSCSDCSISNTLLLPKSSGSLLNQIIISSSDVENFNISLSNPNFYWLDIQRTSGPEIENSFWFFMKFAGLFIVLYVVWFCFYWFFGDLDWGEYEDD